jgi:hypothetical protein
LGLKENVEAIKQELSTEEQFLESVIKAEGFFKKYKKLLITLAVVVIVAVLAYVTIDYIKNRNLRMANQALAALQNNPQDTGALETLKNKNPELYSLFLFAQAVQSNDVNKLHEIAQSVQDPVLKDLVSFQSAALSEDEKALSSYVQKQEALLKEIAVLDDAFLLFQNGKNKEAREMLGQIAVNSPLYQIVQNYMHYQK